MPLSISGTAPAFRRAARAPGPPSQICWPTLPPSDRTAVIIWSHGPSLPQDFGGDVSIAPDKTRLGTMGHAAHFDDAAIEEGFVASVVVADELASPVTQERLRMRATAAVCEVVDDSLQVVVFARAVTPEIRAMRAAEAGL